MIRRKRGNSRLNNVSVPIVMSVVDVRWRGKGSGAGGEEWSEGKGRVGVPGRVLRRSESRWSG